MHYPPSQPPPLAPPPPPPRRGFLGFGVGGALVIVGLSVIGTFARLHNQKHDEERAEKRASLPAVGSQGSLVKAPATASLCPVPKNAFHFGWPCTSDKQALPHESKVRVMKAAVQGTDAVCRYWVQSGPANDASGDAPCEWFVAE